jgi:HAD superfamily hydrolase (TIGR01509 family)
MVKPDAEIFSTMLAEAGLKAEETLFIDDSAANCASAASLGINVLHDKEGEKWMRMLSVER